jgi:hypothetical protein
MLECGNLVRVCVRMESQSPEAREADRRLVLGDRPVSEVAGAGWGACNACRAIHD